MAKKAKARHRRTEHPVVEQQFYTIAQVAQLTGHSTRSVSRWVNRKVDPLPHKRINSKTVLIPKSAFSDIATN